VTDLDELWSALTTEVAAVLHGYRERIETLPVSTKPDRTLLTEAEADVEVETLIAARIREFDPTAVVIGEEDGREGERAEVAAAVRDGRLIFVIDPIDGTAEFVRAGHREFASVVCVLRDLRPAGAFVLAPELGYGSTPVVVTGDRQAGTVRVNGVELAGRAPATGPLWASVTRRTGTEPRAYEAHLEEAGYQIKTETTSQTLDMVRTAIDLSPYSDAVPANFDLFYRPQQKIWDGLAGLCLGETVGLRSSDRTGAARLPVDAATLSAAVPTFDDTILGVPEAVESFLKAL
jgi:3'(2'), 5'-bisphosphate nucleotidase